MPRELTDKTIVITGASSGIGAATAIACAEAGMDVVLSARRSERLEDVAGEVRQRGRRAEIVAGDVCDPGMSVRLLDHANEVLGGFYAVFANAGYGLEKHVIDVPHDELRRVFDVNFFASVELAQEAARRLVDREEPGHLLMCSSCLAKFTMPGYSAYSATKAAQNHVCRAMRLEL
ncbi:MAG: SDR family NAD(P)-dependent oxidoreductase, partial [Planctomycetota bacterium]